MNLGKILNNRCIFCNSFLENTISTAIECVNKDCRSFFYLDDQKNINKILLINMEKRLKARIKNADTHWNIYHFDRYNIYFDKSKVILSVPFLDLTPNNFPILADRISKMKAFI